MSKLIVEMEMPENCKKCPLVGMDHFGQIRCKGQGGRLIHLKNFQTEIERPSWCPIQDELPDKHGDLIDRDEIVTAYAICDGTEAMELVKEAAVIIAAERTEERKNDEQIH